MARYIDISIPTSDRTTVFPGDPQPRIYWPGWSHEKGSVANVGFFQGGLHHGTHVDAPWHFIRGGKRMEEMGLEPFIGSCSIIDTGDADSITPAVLESAGLPAKTERILFKTRNSRSDYWTEPWNPNFVYITEDGGRWCAEHDIRLVGLDYLTIDPPTLPTFPAHLQLLGAEVVILENIRLSHVQPGSYELIAAPVNLQGVDGAWTRALLRTN